MTALFSAVILFLAFYSFSFEDVVREAEKQADALFSSVGRQLIVDENGPVSFSKTPNLFSRMALASEAGIDQAVSASEPEETDVSAAKTIPVAVARDVDANETQTPVGEVSVMRQPQIISSELVESDTVTLSQMPVVQEAVDIAIDDQVFLLRFAFDSAELDERSLSVIQRAMDAIANGSGGIATVAGYSDRSGSSSYNLTLSRKRAQAVADALRDSGVSEDRLRVEGRGAAAVLMGDTSPGASEPGRIAQIIIEESGEW